MAENSAIEWTDHTFNPWVGCTKVSPGCDSCYAAVSTPARSMRIAWGAGQARHRTADSTWALPKRWNDRHAAFFAEHGRRQRVFCASLADVFDNEAPTEWLVDFLDLCRLTPNLDKLLLTKRIGNVMKRLGEALHLLGQRPGCLVDPLFQYVTAWLRGSPPHDIWLGATIVNQEEADRDIPKLLDAPARVRFLSMEPLLGPVDLARMENGDGYVDPLTAWSAEEMTEMWGEPMDAHPRVDWVIVGGESGPGARPMHPDWARSLRDQCAAAGVPFLFKQHGEWHESIEAATSCWVAADGRGAIEHGTEEEALAFLDKTGTQWRLVYRPGKKAAGRVLDGRTHDEFPEATCS